MKLVPVILSVLIFAGIAAHAGDNIKVGADAVWVGEPVYLKDVPSLTFGKNLKQLYQYNVVSVLEKGKEQVKIGGKKYNWFRVQINGPKDILEGWCTDQFLKPVAVALDQEEILESDKQNIILTGPCKDYVSKSGAPPLPRNEKLSDCFCKNGILADCVRLMPGEVLFSTGASPLVPNKAMKVQIFLRNERGKLYEQADGRVFFQLIDERGSRVKFDYQITPDALPMHKGTAAGEIKVTTKADLKNYQLGIIHKPELYQSSKKYYCELALKAAQKKQGGFVFRDGDVFGEEAENAVCRNTGFFLSQESKFEEAQEYFRFACAEDDNLACLNLYFLAKKLGDQKTVDDAFNAACERLKKLQEMIDADDRNRRYRGGDDQLLGCYQGSALDCMYLGYDHPNQVGIKYYSRGCELGNEQSCIEAGRLPGLVEKDFCALAKRGGKNLFDQKGKKKAQLCGKLPAPQSYYQKACDLGGAEGCFLANDYRKAGELYRLYCDALKTSNPKLLETAALAGYRPAYSKLKELYLKAGPKDQALTLLKQVCEANKLINVCRDLFLESSLPSIEKQVYQTKYCGVAPNDPACGGKNASLGLTAALEFACLDLEDQQVCEQLQNPRPSPTPLPPGPCRGLKYSAGAKIDNPALCQCCEAGACYQRSADSITYNFCLPRPAQCRNDSPPGRFCRGYAFLLGNMPTKERCQSSWKGYSLMCFSNKARVECVKDDNGTFNGYAICE